MFNAYIDRHLGHPRIGDVDDFGYDDLGDAEVAADFEEMVRMGWAPIKALQNAAARGRARRCARGAPGGGRGGFPGGGFPGGPSSMRPPFMHPMPSSQDDIDGDDDIAADENEIGEIEGEEDEQVGADGNEEIGATVTQIDRKIVKLQNKLQVLELKLAQTPNWKSKRRNRIMRAIERVKRAIGKRETKKEKKIERLAAKLGVSAAVVGAGLAGAAGAGVTAASIHRAEQAIAKGEANVAQGILGFSPLTPQEGMELRIPLLSGTSPIALFTVGIGVGAREVTVGPLTTPLVSYASFDIVGLDVEVQVQPGVNAQGLPPGDLLINAIASNLTVNGGVNLLYAAQSITQAGQGGRNQSGTGYQFNRTFSGLRDNPVLDANNTAQFTAIVRQEIDNAAAIRGTLAAALIAKRRTDTSLKRYY